MNQLAVFYLFSCSGSFSDGGTKVSSSPISHSNTVHKRARTSTSSRVIVLLQKLKSCYFIGHHTAPNDIQERLLEAIERHITEYGVSEFIVGRYGAFDRMVQSALVKAKKRYPDIILRLLIAYHPAEQPIIPPRGFEGTYYPPELESVPRRCAIIRANQFMIKSVDYLICYDKGYVGNTRELVTIAQGQEKEGLIHIENLAE